MKNYLAAEEVIQEIISSIDSCSHEEILTDLAALERLFPADDRLNYLKSVIYGGAGYSRLAMSEIWNCLSIQPEEKLYRDEMSKILIKGESIGVESLRTYELKKGERRKIKANGSVEMDRMIRYKYAASNLNFFFDKCSERTGLDLFSDDGGGSRSIHNLTGARMIGVGGSLESVSSANNNYGNSRVAFINHQFPFELPEKIFDFAICFDSLEYVDDPGYFIEQLLKSTDGPVFISVPAEEGLCFEKNKGLFDSCQRGYKLNEINSALSKSSSHEIKEIKGQLVYRMEDGIIAGLLPGEKMYLRPIKDDSQFYIFMLIPKR